MARPRRQESFSLFPEVFTVTSVLTDEQFGELMRAAFAYWRDGTEYVPKDSALSIAFGFIVSSFERRKRASESNTENANARWHPSCPQTEVPSCEAAVSGNDEMRNDAKPCETEFCMQTEMRNDAPILSNPVQSSPVQEEYGATSAPVHTRKKFVKPTAEQVEDYCAQQGLNVDAQRFVDYYESVGWVIGKGKPMKSW